MRNGDHRDDRMDLPARLAWPRRRGPLGRPSGGGGKKHREIDKDPMPSGILHGTRAGLAVMPPGLRR